LEPSPYEATALALGSGVRWGGQGGVSPLSPGRGAGGEVRPQDARRGHAPLATEFTPLNRGDPLNPAMTSDPLFSLLWLVPSGALTARCVGYLARRGR
jgi:hypothetical protein